MEWKKFKKERKENWGRKGERWKGGKRPKEADKKKGGGGLGSACQPV